ncbi:MAG: hypothetical protein JWN53_804 [Gemmatimonadetes bacterium]|jgi:hypothetical protein|nr:hypothetical protein [Gemmatimonadota bacterium]
MTFAAFSTTLAASRTDARSSATGDVVVGNSRAGSESM